MNEEVKKLHSSLDYYAYVCASVGYANGAIGELYERLDGVTNPDDRDAFNSQISKMEDARDKSKRIRDQAREDVFKAFEHYYS